MTHDDLDYTLSCLRRSVENGSAWTLYPAGAAALIAEVERLRTHRELCTANLLKGYETGKAEERAAVVAALRRASSRGPMGLSLVNLDSIADAIERGDHRREEE